MTTLPPLTRSQLQASTQLYILQETTKLLDGAVKQIYTAVTESAKRGITSYFHTHNMGVKLPLNQPMQNVQQVFGVDFNHPRYQTDASVITIFSHQERLIEMLKEVFPDSRVEYIEKKDVRNQKIFERGVLIDWS